MKKLGVLLALILFPLTGHAWNGAGHSTGGAVAYYYLKARNPAALNRVLEILRKHPWYNNQKQWAGKLTGLSSDQKNVALFMLASTFPDDARQDPVYGGSSRSKWHYVDYPFVPKGQNVKGMPPEHPNAEEKIAELLGTVKAQKDLAQQAVDICWIFHLIEDIHQPLHAACLFDRNHDDKDGDRGGNETYILFPNSSSPTKLHSYWDGIVKGTFSTIPANAQQLLKKPAYQDGSLTELKKNPAVKDWIVKESFELAKMQTYLNGTITGTESDPTPVENSYSNNARITGERRVVLSGIRIAQKLASIFG
jgi:hypothetical protein